MLTAGLNRPPLIRKKVHALTARLNPKHKLINISFDGLDARLGETPSSCGAELTVLVPPKANSKNMNVPENSLRTAMRSAPS